MICQMSCVDDVILVLNLHLKFTSLFLIDIKTPLFSPHHESDFVSLSIYQIPNLKRSLPDVRLIRSICVRLLPPLDQVYHSSKHKGCYTLNPRYLF
jgi:hypothetical protein